MTPASSQLRAEETRVESARCLLPVQRLPGMWLLSHPFCWLGFVERISIDQTQSVHTDNPGDARAGGYNSSCRYTAHTLATNTAHTEIHTPCAVARRKDTALRETHLQHQLLLSEHRVAAVRGQQDRAVLPMPCCCWDLLPRSGENWGTATRLMLQEGLLLTGHQLRAGPAQCPHQPCGPGHRMPGCPQR